MKFCDYESELRLRLFIAKKCNKLVQMGIRERGLKGPALKNK